MSRPHPRPSPRSFLAAPPPNCWGRGVCVHRCSPIHSVRADLVSHRDAEAQRGCVLSVPLCLSRHSSRNEPSVILSAAPLRFLGPLDRVARSEESGLSRACRSIQCSILVRGDRRVPRHRSRCRCRGRMPLLRSPRTGLEHWTARSALESPLSSVAAPASVDCRGASGAAPSDRSYAVGGRLRNAGSRTGPRETAAKPAFERDFRSPTSPGSACVLEPTA